jgi:hypothetical protein
LRRCDEAVERARLANDRRHLCGSLYQHANLVFSKNARLDRLNDQHSLQNAAVDQRDSQE